MRVTLAAVLAITFLGQAEAGVIAKAPRAETPCPHSSHEAAPTETPSVLSRHIFAEPKSTSLPFGGVFVEPDPSDRPTRTTLLSPVSNTTSVSHETPCEDHHTGSAMIHNTTHVKSRKTTPTPTVDLGLEQKFVQTTYWACATLGSEAHCGWHEPILDASSGAYSKISGANIALRAGGIALFAVGALMLA